MSRPLLDAYTKLRATTPYTPLIEAPTPVERFNRGAIDVPALAGLWIKRDDKTSPVYGGNKVRKLEFVLPQAQQQGEIVTLGATGTNHGVATAIFCRRHGLRCRIILFEQPVTHTVVNNLKLMLGNGAQLDYRGSLLAAGLHFYRLQCLSRLHPGRRYFLPPGGSNVAGCLGYVNAAFELREQIAQGLLPEPDRIICPVGSSGTLAGLTLGCRLAGLRSHVQGIRVAPSHLGPLPICTSATVSRLMRQTYRHLRKASDEVPNLALPDIDLDDTYFGTGYGHATDAGDAALQAFGRRDIDLEATYTAKAAAAALQVSRENPAANVLYWHTFNSVAVATELSSEAYANLPQALRRLMQ